MLTSKMFFANVFNSRIFIPSRLHAFALMVLAALTTANGNGGFTAIIDILTNAIGALELEIGDVDSNLNQQKTDTQTVEEFILSFARYMSESAPFISKALGGISSAGYGAFYPNKLKDYYKATNATMTMLTDRVLRASKKYGSKLDADMTAMLESFSPDFKANYTTQQTQIRTVQTDRAERNTASAGLQLALMQAIFTVGNAYPGDEAKCATFFPFEALYSQGRKQLYTATGEAAAEAQVNVLAQILGKNVSATLSNPGLLANYAFWLAALPTDAMPAGALQVMVGSVPATITVGSLPDYETRPYFMVKNLSDNSACTYSITFSGGRHKIEGKTVTGDMKVLSA